VWAIGHKRTNHVAEAVPDMVLLGTSGIVTDQYPDGRPDFPAACISVEMDSMGGMSGGPVFNARGNVIGVISKSMAQRGENRPTVVSLLFSVFSQSVSVTWPPGVWPSPLPDGLSTLNYAKRAGFVHINGSVVLVPEGLDITGYDPRIPETDPGSLIIAEGGLRPVS